MGNEAAATMLWRRIGIGPALIIASALFYGMMNISVKLSASHLTVWQTAMGRFALGVIFVPILVHFLRVDLLGHGRWYLLARGLSGTFAFLLVIKSFRMIPLSTGLVLFYLWPVFSCLLSSWIAGEPTTKREWFFVAGAFLGTALILWPAKAGQTLNLGHFLALSASFFGGLAIILVRRLRRINNPFTIYFYFCSIGILFCLGPYLTQNSPLLPVSKEGWLCLVAVACFAMLGQVLMNYGMKYLNASRTSSLMMIEVLVASAFGVLYLSETLSPRLLAGSILILGCGAALILLPVHPSPMETVRDTI